MRKIFDETVEACTVKIYYGSDLAEYTVKTYIFGERQEGHDYFTPWEDDAVDTANAILRAYHLN